MICKMRRAGEVDRYARVAPLSSSSFHQLVHLLGKLGTQTRGQGDSPFDDASACRQLKCRCPKPVDICAVLQVAVGEQEAWVHERGILLGISTRDVFPQLSCSLRGLGSTQENEECVGTGLRSLLRSVCTIVLPSPALRTWWTSALRSEEATCSTVLYR